jgi:ActR/RegA family two-component response regulator
MFSRSLKATPMAAPQRLKEEPVARLATQLRALRTNGDGARVMIVEDEPFIAMAIEDALADDGFEVCGVYAAEAPAIAAARTLRPAFAVVDVRLAPGDGRRVARVLSEECGSVVLMASAEDIATLGGAGAAGVLSKPYDATLVGTALVTAARWMAGLHVDHVPARLSPLAAG